MSREVNNHGKRKATNLYPLRFAKIGQQGCSKDEATRRPQAAALQGLRPQVYAKEPEAIQGGVTGQHRMDNEHHQDGAWAD